jgi:hypothetical protein
MKFATGFHQVIAALENASVPYLVGGSFASSHHGLPRATNDADLLVDLQPSEAPAFTSTLRPDFYVDDTAAMEAARSRRSFNAIHMATVYKFDFFIANQPFHYAQLDRAAEVTFDFMGEPLTCRIASAEDTILAKLDWYRIGGCTSQRQLRDIANVLAVSGLNL